MAKKVIVITGGGTGIGQALAWHFANSKQSVLAIGRRLCALEKTKNKDKENIHIFCADVGREQDRQKIAQWFFDNDFTIKFLIHNAAVLEPVKTLLNITPAEWREHMQINVEGPLFLTQSLLPYMHNTRILHISSGAAHNAYQGWGAYCTSKAALYMIYQILKKELHDKKICVGSVKPGVVDTPMQDRVREADEKVFPDLSKFIDLKNEKKLYTPERVASFIAYLLTETSERQFSEKEWDIRETNF